MRHRLTIAAGIVIAAATALSGQPVYRLHDNGELWATRAETCSGHACVEWHLLDNNPNTRTRQIAAGARSLYQRHDNGAIWRYGSCPGWQLLYDPTTWTIVSTQN